MQFVTKTRILFFSMCLFVHALDETDNSVRRVTKKYYLSLVQANYFQAFVYCKQGEMELASIANEYESAALDAFLDPYKIVGWYEGFWLSGTHLIDTSTSQYFWLATGERTIFTNWLPIQPNNANGEEHCMQWAYDNVTLLTGWNDLNCNITLRFVCEFTED